MRCGIIMLVVLAKYFIIVYDSVIINPYLVNLAL
jgi:hypothetical protein